MGANTKIETVFDVVKHRANLAIECVCGHASIVDAAKLSRWYQLHLFDIRMHMLSDHLRCTRCRGRPQRLRITHQVPNAPARWPKDEDGWKRLQRRLRG